MNRKSLHSYTMHSIQTGQSSTEIELGFFFKIKVNKREYGVSKVFCFFLKIYLLIQNEMIN